MSTVEQDHWSPSPALRLSIDTTSDKESWHAAVPWINILSELNLCVADWQDAVGRISTWIHVERIALSHW